MWPTYFYRTYNLTLPSLYKWVGNRKYLGNTNAVITSQGFPWNRYTLKAYEDENLYRIANLMKHCNKQKWEF